MNWGNLFIGSRHPISFHLSPQQPQLCIMILTLPFYWHNALFLDNNKKWHETYRWGLMAQMKAYSMPMKEWTLTCEFSQPFFFTDFDKQLLPFRKYSISICSKLAQLPFWCCSHLKVSEINQCLSQKECTPANWKKECLSHHCLSGNKYILDDWFITSTHALNECAYGLKCVTAAFCTAAAAPAISEKMQTLYFNGK